MVRVKLSARRRYRCNMTQTTHSYNFKSRRAVKTLAAQLALCSSGALVVAYASAVALDVPNTGCAPLWVHIMPLGKSDTLDGRHFNLADPKAVILASMARGGQLLVDYDHATDLAAPGSTKPAAGWISDMEVRSDGLYARVDWVASAAAAIKAREYRFVSPVFIHDKQGAVAQILRLSLTNNPALPIKALAQFIHTLKDDDMNLLEKLRAALGLAATASEDDALTSVTALCSAMTDVRKQLKVSASDDLLVALASVQSAGVADPARYVPLSQFEDVRKSLASLQQSVGADRAAQAVDAAVVAGKVAPGMKDWALAYASSDAAGFARYLEQAPVVLESGAKTLAGAPTGAADVLTAEEKAVCAATGTAHAVFLAQKKREAGAAL
jgi:phage I-like protein